MSTDRLYSRDRSESCIRRSASFDPYILSRSASTLFYDQHVRRSFTPLRENIGLTRSRYSSSPYGFHYSRPDFTSYSRPPRVYSSSNLYRAPSPVTVYDSPVLRSRYRFDHYVPTGWSAPIYRYMHPRRSRSACRGDHFGFASSYASPYSQVYKPPSMRYNTNVSISDYYPSGPVYKYHANIKSAMENSYNWQRWLDTGGTRNPWYRESQPRNDYRTVWTTAPRQYVDRAIWV